MEEDENMSPIRRGAATVQDTFTGHISISTENMSPIRCGAATVQSLANNVEKWLYLTPSHTSSQRFMATLILGLQQLDRLSQVRLLEIVTDGDLMPQTDILVQLCKRMPELTGFTWAIDGPNTADDLAIQDILGTLAKHCPFLYEVHLFGRPWPVISPLGEGFKALTCSALSVALNNMRLSNRTMFDGILHCVQSHPSGLLGLRLYDTQLPTQFMARLVDTLVSPATNKKPTIEDFCHNDPQMHAPSITRLVKLCTGLKKVELDPSFEGWSVADIQAFGNAVASRLESFSFLGECDREKGTILFQAMSKAQPFRLYELELSNRLLWEPLMSCIRDLNVSTLRVRSSIPRSSWAALQQNMSLIEIDMPYLDERDQVIVQRMVNRNKKISRASKFLKCNDLNNRQQWISCVEEVEHEDAPDGGDITAVFHLLRGCPQHIYTRPEEEE